MGHAAIRRIDARLRRAFGFWLVDGWIERRMGRYIRLHSGPDTTFLDVGCGVDTRLRAYLPPGVIYHGIDILPDLVDSPCAQRPDCNLLVADARSMPFPDGSFSVVASMEVLYEIAEWRTVLEEMRRVIAPGGIVVLSVPNAYCHKYAKKGPHPSRRSAGTFAEYAAALRKAGFAVIDSAMLGWWLPVLPAWKYSIMFPVASRNEYYNCNFFFVCRATKE